MRTYNSTDYRFGGAGGQEKDNEILNVNGALTTAEYWELDTRLGRRWDIDPVVKPWLSSYSSFYNNPIFFTDPTGEDPPEKLSKVERFKNRVLGKSYRNEANDFAVENDIDESFIHENKEGKRIEISSFQTVKVGENESKQSVYELQESTFFFIKGGYIGRTISSDSKGNPALMDLLSTPEQSYGIPPDAALTPLLSAKNIKDVAKFVRLGSASLKMTLPAWRKVAIDMEHIISGHTIGGSRVSKLKSLFPSSYDATQVERTIRSAYKNVHTKLATQGDRILLQGTAENGMNIEMWLNKSTKTIETAYPK